MVIVNGVGCAYATPTVHIPEFMPIAPKKLELAEVLVMRGGQPVEAELESDVRRQTAEILEGAAGDATERGRARVRVDLEWKYDVFDAMREDGFAAFVLLYAPFGLAIGRERVSAEVTIEVGGRTFVGRGMGEKIGSIYACPRRRALATALDRALADSTAHHR